MKTNLTLAAGLLLLVVSVPGFGQTDAASAGGARDLYNTYGKSEPAITPSHPSSSKHSIGRPGVRVRVELDRGGRARWVSSKTVFQAGDRVRFHFAMNFSGYVAIINQGSSGKRSLLFPYEGVSNHIGRTADYTVPQGEGWFEFDNTPGEEQLTFIMSKRDIAEVSQLTAPASHTANVQSVSTSHPAPTPAPPQAVPAPAVPATVSHETTPPAATATAAPAPAPAMTEEQEILAALNSRSLTGGRDLKLAEDNTDGYVLASEEALAKPLGFKLTLKHR